MSDKVPITATALLADSFRLAARVLASGFEPSLLIGVWRGGTPVAIAMHEFFVYRGITPLEHFPVQTSSYGGVDARSGTIEVNFPDALLKRMHTGQRLLVVDDVFDTGLSLDELLGRLRAAAGSRFPADTRIACPWYKPARNRTGRIPDYFLHETDRWLLFPHELQGLDSVTLRRMKPELAALFDELDSS